MHYLTLIKKERANITVDQKDLAAIMALAYNVICEYSGSIPNCEIAAYNRIAAIAGIRSDLLEDQ